MQTSIFTKKALASFSCLFTAISIGFSSLPVTAATFGITPFPKGGENATPRDQTNALKMCVDAGVTGIFYGGTWADLEPSKGTYSLTSLAKTLKYSPKLTRFVGVQVFDITTKNMPSDLVKAKLDSPKVAARFAQLMARLKKTIGGNIAYISIGNEADVYLSKHPKDVDSFMKFFKQAKADVVKVFPGCKVGITLRAENMLNGKTVSPLAQKLLDESDVAMFNYYAVDNYKPKKPQQVEQDMATLKATCGDKEIVFQEIGYPASVKLGSSDKNQADFIDLTFKEIRKNPQILFANFFALHDLTPAICDFLAEHYTISSKNYRQAMQSVGLRRSSGKPRPAWEVIKKALADKPEVKVDTPKPEDMPTDVAPGETLPPVEKPVSAPGADPAASPAEKVKPTESTPSGGDTPVSSPDGGAGSSSGSSSGSGSGSSSSSGSDSSGSIAPNSGSADSSDSGTSSDSSGSAGSGSSGGSAGAAGASGAAESSSDNKGNAEQGSLKEGKKKSGKKDK